MNALYIKWINVLLSAFFVLVFLCDAFSCVILLKIGIPIELEWGVKHDFSMYGHI